MSSGASNGRERVCCDERSSADVVRSEVKTVFESLSRLNTIRMSVSVSSSV